MRKTTAFTLLLALLGFGLSGCGHPSPKNQDATGDPTAEKPARHLNLPSHAKPSPVVVRPGCPRFTSGEELGIVASPELTEASGLVASRQNPGVLWSHNDKGGKAHLFAMTTKGEDLGTYTITKSEVVDWEDIALVPGDSPDRWFIYAGDIGANAAPRKEIAVFRIREPKVSLTQRPARRKLKHRTKYQLRFADSVSHNAEALMVDPINQDIYVATKTLGADADLFRAKAPLHSARINVLERVASLKLGSNPGTGAATITAGDISADGAKILIRTYSDAFLWTRQSGEDIATAVTREPCQVPLHIEPQGEAIAFAADREGYLTVSEGPHPSVYFFGPLP